MLCGTFSGSDNAGWGASNLPGVILFLKCIWLSPSNCIAPTFVLQDVPTKESHYWPGVDVSISASFCIFFPFEVHQRGSPLILFYWIHVNVSRQASLNAVNHSSNGQEIWWIFFVFIRSLPSPPSSLFQFIVCALWMPSLLSCICPAFLGVLFVSCVQFSGSWGVEGLVPGVWIFYARNHYGADLSSAKVYSSWLQDSGVALLSDMSNISTI